MSVDVRELVMYFAGVAWRAFGYLVFSMVQRNRNLGAFWHQGFQLVYAFFFSSIRPWFCTLPLASKQKQVLRRILQPETPKLSSFNVDLARSQASRA